MSSCLTVNDLVGGLHPSDEGYQKMADCWYNGIQRAASNGWINAPVANAPTTANPNNFESQGTCVLGLFFYHNHGTIAAGVGSADAAFAPNWNGVGNLAAGGLESGDLQGTGIRFGDMFGFGISDYLWTDPKTGALRMYHNGGYSVAKGVVIWDFWGPIADGLGDGPGVILADLDGDGRSDYLWVSPSGAVTCYRNVASGPANANAWVWNQMATNLNGLGGGTRQNIRFADIDGDGRADYLVIGTDGSVNAWLNSGSGPPFVWQSMGQIAAGTGSSDLAGVHMVDLNGDGKADYVWLDKNGAATAYINYQGHAPGARPNFIPSSINPITAGVGTSRDNITFADMTGDGKLDYVFVNITTGGLNVWINLCTGGTSRVGEGTRFADLTGDGRDDYIAMGINCGMTGYLNGGWDDALGHQIWLPVPPIAGGVGAKRADVRLADINGDGRADYVVVDEKSGAITVWVNAGRSPNPPNEFVWLPPANVPLATGAGTGRGVQLVDINGDGRADYLWVGTNGAVTAYLNGGQNAAASTGWVWLPVENIALGVGAARAEVRFADLNGDGMADYLWVDRLTGSVQAWYNGGGVVNDWIWKPQGQVAGGVGANGLSIFFGDTTGDGRDDYLNIDPVSGSVDAWLNGCSGGFTGGSGPAGPGGGQGGPGGGGSGSSSGTVYLDPSIWLTENSLVQCEPPCTLVFPPYTLGSPVIVTWPPFSTSVLSSSNGAIVTKNTVFTIPVFTTTKIDFSPVTVETTDPTVVTIRVEQSVMPPRFTITLPGTEATISVTEQGTSPTSTSTIPPVFFLISHPVTFQPFPTVTIPVPPPPSGTDNPAAVTFSVGPPKPTCVTGCGSINCDFGCGGTDCGLFGCGGGCGLFGCGGGCGLLGCSGGCGLLGCGNGRGGGGGGGEPPCQGNDCPSKCDATKTVGSACSVHCPETVVPWTTTTDSCTTTCTDTSTSCGAMDSTTTATAVVTIIYPAVDDSIDDPLYNQDYGAPEATMVYSAMQSRMSEEDSSAANLAPTPTLCSQGADPGNGNDDYCNCSNFPYTLPTLASTTNPYYPCGYTTLPPPWPYTSTDSAGDIIACQTSNVVNGATSCSGATSTVFTTPPPPPKATQVFNIGWETGCDPTGEGPGTGSSCTSYWTVFTDPAGTTYNPCNDLALYVDTKPLPATNKPGYPISLGPFSARGFNTCTFKTASATDAGTLACDTVSGICLLDKGSPNDCPISGIQSDTWNPKYVCSVT